jgi:osmotically-inducible protein OsmY
MRTTNLTAALGLALSLAGCEAASNAAAGAGVFAEQTIDRAKDASIKLAIKAALTDDPGVQAKAVEIYVVEGVVTLRGAQPTLEARARAETDAWKARGVMKVVNEIQVTSAAPPGSP